MRGKIPAPSAAAMRAAKLVTDDIGVHLSFHGLCGVAQKIDECTGLPDLLLACQAALSLLTDDGQQRDPILTTNKLKIAIAKAEGN